MSETSDIVSYETYQPTPRQLEAHQSSKKYKLYGGAMGGGKSVWLCAEIIRLAIKYPGNQVLLARKSYRDLKRTTLSTLYQMLPNSIVANINRADGMIKLKNRSEIITSDLEYPDKFKSFNLGAFGIDEATEVNEDVFLMLCSRLRRKLPNIRYFGLLATNPEPGWLKERFIIQSHPNGVFVPALPRDNPHLPKDYVSELERDLPAIWRAKYIEGSWDDFGGQVFKSEWIRPSENFDPEQIAVKFAAIDPAISEKQEADETAICVIGIDYDGIMHEIETAHGRWSYDETLKQISAVNARHKLELIGVEKVAFQTVLYEQLLKMGLPAIALTPDGDKVRRAIVVSHMFERGLVRINSYDLQRQLIEFPKATHDDLVDACVYCLRMIRDHSRDRYERKDERLKGLDGRSKVFWKGHLDEVSGLTEREDTNRTINQILGA